MAALKASSLVLNSASQKREITKATISMNGRSSVSNSSIPVLPETGFKDVILEQSAEKRMSPIETLFKKNQIDGPDLLVVAKLYAIMEAVADRVEMHSNIGEQRNNWNRLLLTSINAITLTAATMAGIAAVGSGAPAEAMKVSSTAMYLAATGILLVVNKIQPSQLAEEQRNAVRFFKQIQNQIKTVIAIGNPTSVDVKEMMEKVLALDKAYPLPLLGVMLEKFPAAVEPAVWWPEQGRKQPKLGNEGYNGWNGKLEEEMKEIIKVIKSKDIEDYLRLDGKALKLNKFLAVSSPVLTGLAAVGSAFVGSPYDGGWAVMLAVSGGALASVVNALEHGGQVGMAFEMYRSNAGFFKMMEETIEQNLREEEPERRENGEVFEMKVGLQLGRSLSELRDLSAAAAVKGDDEVDEFASKLF